MSLSCPIAEPEQEPSPGPGIIALPRHSAVATVWHSSPSICAHRTSGPQTYLEKNEGFPAGQVGMDFLLAHRLVLLLLGNGLPC